MGGRKQKILVLMCQSCPPPNRAPSLRQWHDGWY